MTTILVLKFKKPKSLNSYSPQINYPQRRFAPNNIIWEITHADNKIKTLFMTRKN